MKIYISLPITGHDIEEVEAQTIFASGVIEKKGHTAVNPLYVCAIDDSYEAHIGADIIALMRCEAVLFLQGWKESKGCKLEYQAAKIYGKTIYSSLDAIPENSALWYQLGKEEEQ